jgi:hypothetical protein
VSQFDRRQRELAAELVESLAWGDVERAIIGHETALALALEATGDALRLWEHEGEDRFGDEVSLSPEQVCELDDEWRLAYIARLLVTALHAYGVSPGGRPARLLVVAGLGEVTPPADWQDARSSPARLLHGLNDLLYGVSVVSRQGTETA